MTTRHCRDPHCANFATGDSDWCRKHGAQQFPPVDWHGLSPAWPPSGDQSEAFAHFHDGPGPVLAADEHRRLLATGKVHPDGRVEKSFVNPHVAGTHDLQPGYDYPDAGTAWDEAGARAAEAMATLKRAADGAKKHPRRHRAPKTDRRRTWRHPIRGVVSP